MSQAVQVGDVKDPAHGGRVHAPRPSLLETQVGQDLTEAGVLERRAAGGVNRRLSQVSVDSDQSKQAEVGQSV